MTGGRRFLLVLAGVLVLPACGLRLTHMTAPLVADVTQPLKLDCHFDMGAEELYAVKWYKNDHEFFRFMPSHDPETMAFPVPGVHPVPGRSDCSQRHCEVWLSDLSRVHSGGAYRCEVSSEAPTFRLAAETHNVTVAALPKRHPEIRGVSSSYAEGDVVEAKCVSDPADPAPILHWYINGQEAPPKAIGETTSSEPTSEGLVSRSLTLRFQTERRHSRGNAPLQLECVSRLPGIPLSPQTATLSVPVFPSPEVRLGGDGRNQQQHQHQQLLWTDSSASSSLESSSSSGAATKHLLDHRSGRVCIVVCLLILLLIPPNL